MKKCTYKIFPLWQIDCDFSTNRRVYLGKKGSRDLNQPDAPEKTGSSETGKVTDHASSQCNDQVTSGKSGIQHRRINLRKCLKTFRRFTMRKDKRMAFIVLQGIQDSLSIKRKNMIIRDEHNFLSGKEFTDITSGLRQDSIFNINRISIRS